MSGDDDGIDTRKLDEILSGYSGKSSAVISALQDVQKELGWLPRIAIERIAAALGVPASQVYGVATFYNSFRLHPVGRHMLRVCHGTACHVGGAENISRALIQKLEVEHGQTTKDKKFTLEKVACLGCCSLAPCIMIDTEVYGRLTPDKAKSVVTQFGKEGKK
jgi:NADH-quinone oxidoreductase subunit E